MVTRTQAVERIAVGLGFRTGLDSLIILRLQEAQRDLEKGKTLPRFLIQQDYTVTLLAGAHTVALPTGFIRMVDDQRPHFTPSNSDTPVFLTRKYLDDALISKIRTDDEARAPSIYVIRQATIDFVTTADVAYAFTLSYYKAAATLDADVENAWLANASEWIIGEAGGRLAMDLRDKQAIEIFQVLEKKGRAAVFGEDIVEELADGPLAMGSNQ